MQDWRDAVWRAVPEGAEPERFAARRAFLLEHVAAGERVLDLGCGDGAFAAELLAAGCAVTMADVAGRGAAARPRAGAGRGGRRSSTRARRCRSTRTPSTSCGPARCSSTWPTSSACWPRCAACCAGAGRLLVTTPWHGRLVVATDAHFDPRADHLRFFSARTLRAVLADAGFASARVRRAGRGLHATRLLAELALLAAAGLQVGLIASCERGSR